MAKVPGLGADAIVYDLEDAVAPAARPAARTTLIEALAATATAPFERIVRINAIGSEDFGDDLDAVARGRPMSCCCPRSSPAMTCTSSPPNAGGAVSSRQPRYGR